MRMLLESLSNYFHFCVRLRLTWKTETDFCGMYVTVQMNLGKEKVQREGLSLFQQLFLSQVHVSPRN